MKRNQKSCPRCGTPMLKNGHDSNGKQRWRCRECGKTGRWINDVTARDLGFSWTICWGKPRNETFPARVVLSAARPRNSGSYGRYGSQTGQCTVSCILMASICGVSRSC
ncbi:transposase-like zinc-binding domain-containing protein [Mobiluncus mulieris]|uniref:transposase-like zinc-binding domain-containing protein n=1 Tax=Mobiluncus mulieris TaxID=2052 RepID=UPI003D17313B